MGQAMAHDAHLFCGQFTTAVPGLALNDDEAMVLQDLFGGLPPSVFCFPS